MRIEYITPLEKSLETMKTILFRPFDLRKWFILGFSAFLAGLASFSGGNPGANLGGFRDETLDEFDGRSLIQLPVRAWNWLFDNPLFFVLILFAIVLMIVIISALLYLSSRGKFMFLDNVVHNRAEIREPWRQFKALGTSLFLFKISVSLIALAMFGVCAVVGILLALVVFSGSSPSTPLVVIYVLAMVAIIFLLVVIFSYVELFTESFVIPIMYKHNLKVLAGWRRLIALSTQYPVPLLLFGLFYFGLNILLGLAILLTGCLTCCIGFLVVVLPYIGSVALLPVSVTFRVLSLEFIAQFGPDFQLIPEPQKPQPELSVQEG